MSKKKNIAVFLLSVLWCSVIQADQDASFDARSDLRQGLFGGTHIRASKAPVITATAARALLTYQKVQSLSSSVIVGSRILQAQELGGVILPDGDEVRGHLSTSVNQDAWLYRITYRSTDIKGKPTTLSGLVAVPMVNGKPGDATGGFVIYMHSTTSQRLNASGDRSIEAYSAISNLAGEKWVLVMPDYLGYGVNRQPHPYAMARLNAMSGASMTIAAQELMKYLNFAANKVGTQLNVTGFSEGGGNAMGLGRYIQENWKVPVKIAPMAGPYDLSGATAKSFIAPQQTAGASLENTTVKPTLLAFSGISTAQVLGQPSWMYLLDPLAQQAAGLFPGPYSDDDVGARILTTAINDLGYLEIDMSNFSATPHPENLLQPQLIEAIETHDLSNPAVKLWAANDMVNWTVDASKTRIYMLGAIQDPLVPFASKTYPLPPAYLKQKGLPAPYASGNAENVIRAMRARKYGPNVASWLGFNGLIEVDDNGKAVPKTVMGHSGSYAACIIMAAEFFRGQTPLEKLPRLPDPK